MAVPGLAARGHRAGSDVQRREQGGGAVADVVVGAPLGQPGLHGQHRRGPVQRLDLRFLVHAQHDRVLRRGQVEPDDVGDLGDQLGVGGELERLAPPRRHPVLPPRPRHGGVPDPQMRGQQPARPVRDPELLRWRPQRGGDDLAGGRSPAAGPTGASSANPPIPLRSYAGPPAGHRRPRHPDPRGDLDVGSPRPRPAARSAPAAPARPGFSRHVGSDTPGLPPQTTRCCTDRTDCSREPDLGKLLAHLRPVDSSAWDQTVVAFDLDRSGGTGFRRACDVDVVRP